MLKNFTETKRVAEVTFLAAPQSRLKPYNANIAPQAPAVKRQKPGGRFHITQKKPPRPPPKWGTRGAE